MCSLYMPFPEPPAQWGSPARRLYTPLQPPRPLPWYIRDPVGALIAAIGITLAILLFLKFAELLGSF